ncbi:MAG: fibronectin type protein, partial [Chloroflexi bacterium]|nr:fibronectin type protein [Chloroflexota bacterium]
VLGLDSVQLTWNAPVNDRDGFYIYEGENTVAAVNANTTQWTITGWDRSVQHCYEVVAFNGAGQSAPSNSVCAGPVETPTVQPTATIQASPTSTAVPATQAVAGPTATPTASPTPV